MPLEAPVLNRPILPDHLDRLFSLLGIVFFHLHKFLLCSIFYGVVNLLLLLPPLIFLDYDVEVIVLPPLYFDLGHFCSERYRAVNHYSRIPQPRVTETSL